VQNSDLNSIFTLSNNGTATLFKRDGNGLIANIRGTSIQWLLYQETSIKGRLIYGGLTTDTENGQSTLISSFAPTSGVAVFNNYQLNPTINQTGGANGITRGLYVNPTLTAAADWRSIEWSNNSGWGLYGAGTANNYLGGSLGIGSTSISASAILQADSTTKGFLMPRMTTTQRDAIATPATGLQIYNTTTNANNYYDGTAWVAAGGGVGTTIYTGDGTLVGDRIVTSNGNRLTILGGKEDYANAQVGLTLQGSATNKDVYLNLKNTNASGKEYSFASLTDGSFILFNYTNLSNVFIYTPSTKALLLDAAGSLKMNNIHLGYTSSLSALWFTGTTAVGDYAITQAAGSTYINAPASGNIYFAINNGTAKATITAAGRLLLGTTSEATYLLDVNGTARVSGDMLITKNTGAVTELNVVDTTNSITSGAFVKTQAGSTQGYLISHGQLTTPYKTITSGGVALFKSGTAGDITILNDHASGNITIAAGGSSTAHMTIKSNGRINMSSLPTSATGLSAGDLWNDGGTLKIV
jgi:hypothetical protein